MSEPKRKRVYPVSEERAQREFIALVEKGVAVAMRREPGGAVVYLTAAAVPAPMPAQESAPDLYAPLTPDAP